MNPPHPGIEHLQALADRNAFHRWLGMRIVAVEPDRIELTIAWREELVSNPQRQSTHGGILATLIDAAGDYAVATRAGEPVPTVDLRVDYHRTATPGDLRAMATLIHYGGTLASAETRVFDREDRMVASGRAVYFTGSLKGREGKSPA